MRDSKPTRETLSDDKEKLRELTENCVPMIRYIIFPILKDEREREACFNDVIKKAAEKIGSYPEEKDSFKSRLSVLTRNMALSRAGKLRETDGYIGGENPVSSNADPETERIKSETLKRLEAAVGELSERDKLLFYRRFYYCQSVSQIAAETGMTRRAAERRILRLKKKLWKGLGGESHE